MKAKQKYALAKVSEQRDIDTDISVTMIMYFTKHGKWKVHPERDEIDTFEPKAAVILAKDYNCSLIIIP